MRNVDRLIIAGMVLCCLMTASCRRNVFDFNTLQQIMNVESTVDSIDKFHNWQLMTSRRYTLKIPEVKAKRLYVLSANPLNSDDAEIMAQMAVSDGEEVRVYMYVPNNLTRLYAAIQDENGTFTVASFFTTSSNTVNFYTYLAEGKALELNRLQTVTYLYEESAPAPSDYDYNDVVMRISGEVVSDRQVDIHVTLSAVGATKQIAGGIRLVGYQYQSVDSVTTEGGESFNKGGAKHDRAIETYQFWESDQLLWESRDQEPLIALFEDAHWALAGDDDIDNNLQTRKYYNTVVGAPAPGSAAADGTETAKTLPERTVTYHVYFKQGTYLSEFSMAKVDPFILESELGANWEVHNHMYRQAQVKLEYQLADVRALPWALVIPDGTFRYPVEGRHIGFGKAGTDGDEDAGFFGPYAEPKHSFAEWSYNMKNSTDWYLHLYNEKEAY